MLEAFEIPDKDASKYFPLLEPYKLIFYIIPRPYPSRKFTTQLFLRDDVSQEESKKFLPQVTAYSNVKSKVYKWKKWVLFSHPGRKNDAIYDCHTNVWNVSTNLVPHKYAVASVTSGGNLLVVGSNSDDACAVTLYHSPVEKGIELTPLKKSRKWPIHGIVKKDGKEFMILAGGSYLRNRVNMFRQTCEYINVDNVHDGWKKCDRLGNYAISFSSIVWKNVLVTIVRYNRSVYKIKSYDGFGSKWGYKWNIRMKGLETYYLGRVSRLYLRSYHELCVTTTKKEEIIEYCRNKLQGGNWYKTGQIYKSGTQIVGSLNPYEFEHLSSFEHVLLN